MIVLKTNNIAKINFRITFTLLIKNVMNAHKKIAARALFVKATAFFIVRRTRLTAVGALALAFSCHAFANPLATQASLDALFSMEAVQVEGSERTSPPAGFAAEQPSEEDLTKFLAAQKKRGADFNNYRQQGTVLHHAIRGGLQDTALWLIKNGANPSLPIQGDAENPDALGVAIQVDAGKVTRALMRAPAFAKMPPAERATRYWPQAMQSGDRATTLMDMGFPLPRFDTTPAMAQRLLIYGLCSAQVRVVQALLKAEPAAQPAAIQTPGPVCFGGAPSLPKAERKSTLTEWKAIEARLQWTLLPYVIAHPQSDAQLQALIAAGLRQPWGDLVATKQFIWSALNVNRPAVVPLLKAVPTASLQAAMADASLSRLWFRQTANWPLAELEWALTQLNPSELSRQLPTILDDWNYANGTRRDAKDSADRLARWTLLTRRLRAPLPLIENGTFLYTVPVDLWPQWFVLGVKVTDAQWAGWLAWVSPEKLKLAWPALAKSYPEVAKRSLTWLIAPVSVGPIDDPLARTSSYQGGYWSSEGLQKLQFLYSQGVRVAQARWLAAAYVTDKNEPWLHFALQQGLVKLPPAALRHQVSLMPLGCRPIVSSALRLTLAHSGQSVKSAAQAIPKNVEFDTLQPVALPGQDNCGWLGTQAESGGRKTFDEEDFFQGVRRLRPCTDAQFSSELWRDEKAKWLPVEDTPNGDIVAINVQLPGQNQAHKHTVFATLGVDQGTCGKSSGGVVEGVFAKDGSLSFRALSPGHPVFDALALQCGFDSLGACLGLTEGISRVDEALGIEAFADKYWAAEKQAFLSAVDRLDRSALNQAKAEGLFTTWVGAAVIRVSDAKNLTVDDKRRRIAWLLAQRTLLTSFSSETMAKLAVWLPAQDWGPILESNRCGNRYSLQEFERLTKEQKLSALNNRINQSLATPCKPAS